MTLPEAQRAMVAEAVAAGSTIRSRLLRSTAILTDLFPLTGDVIGRFDHRMLVETDSFVLQFSNMVAVVQDRLMRALLTAEQEDVAGRSRLDRLHTAQKLGALPEDIAFAAMLDARNRIAHTYPNEPDKQAIILNKVWMAAPEAIRAFDEMAGYAARRGFLAPPVHRV